MAHVERDVAVALIQQERRRQVEVEGRTLDHDDEHKHGEIALAAACYAVGQDLVREIDPAENAGMKTSAVWPWDDDGVEDAIEGKSRVRQLVIAGALILAEIERRLRAGEQV